MPKASRSPEGGCFQAVFGPISLLARDFGPVYMAEFSRVKNLVVFVSNYVKSESLDRISCSEKSRIGNFEYKNGNTFIVGNTEVKDLS